MIIAGLLTHLGRLSFVVLLGQREMPHWLHTALRYVPVTALTALAMPTIAITDGVIDISLNPKILAGFVASIVAWRSQNILLTIIAGMVTFWISRSLLGI